MPGPSRLWSKFSSATAAAYRALFRNTGSSTGIRESREARFLSGSRTHEALCIPASISACQPFNTFTHLIRFNHTSSGRSLSSSSFSGWRGAFKSGDWRSRVFKFCQRPSQSSSELLGRGFYYSSSSGITGTSFQGPRFASSSTSYAAKLPRRGGQPQSKPKVRSVRSRLKSRQTGGAVERKGRPAFSGALSSIKGLQSEKSRGNSRTGLVREGDATKRNVGFSSRFVKKEGRALPSPTRKSARAFRFRSEQADHGLKVKRKRKRIKPRPKDVTYKRGLVSDAIPVTGNTAQKAVAAEKAVSLNAQFRQIQPSRELLAHIEENCLGRRRLAEWRKGGYDPKRTAPLDDIPDGKTKRNPIQETVFKHKLTFVAAAKQIASLPPLQYPEVAFAGRSNVGKSSLINALTRRWGVARTSEKPGLTQSINFFTLGSQLCLVDLPGYGFAYAKEEAKEDWEELG